MKKFADLRNEIEAQINKNCVLPEIQVKKLSLQISLALWAKGYLVPIQKE